MPALKPFQVPVALLTKYFPQTQPLGHQPCSTSTDFPAQVGADPTPSMASIPPLPREGRSLLSCPPSLPTFYKPRSWPEHQNPPRVSKWGGSEQAIIGNNCVSVQLNLPSGAARDHECISKSMNHFSWSSLLFNAF